ncbi:MAG: hypothetical protein U0401_27600 [Anaerolineae bacterium]
MAAGALPSGATVACGRGDGLIAALLSHRAEALPGYRHAHHWR